MEPFRLLALPVAFRTVMRLAEHLAVLKRGCSALAPGGNVVGIHLIKLVDLCLHAVMADRAERAV